MPESHVRIKALLQSSPTLVPDLIGDLIEDPGSLAFPLHPVHSPKTKTGFPLTNGGNDRWERARMTDE